MRIISLIASLLFCVSLYGQIETQTNFLANINKPLDDRGQIATLADTSTIAFTGAGVVTYVVDISQLWIHTGVKWIPVGTAIFGEQAPDTTIQRLYLPAHGYDLNNYDGNILAVKEGYLPASTINIDSVQIGYVTNIPHPDSIDFRIAGTVTRTAHGLPLEVHYLQDATATYSTTPDPDISSPVFLPIDANTITLLEQGTVSGFNIPRLVIASPFITSMGGDPRSPSDSSIQKVAELFASIGRLKPGSILVTQFNGSTNNPTHRASTFDPSTPSQVWIWNGQIVTRTTYATVAYNLRDTVYGSLNNIPLTPITGSPTAAKADAWVISNVANGASVPNGTVLYDIGNGTASNPDYAYVVLDDLTEWGQLTKEIKTPVDTFNLIASQSYTDSVANSIETLANTTDGFPVNRVSIEGTGTASLFKNYYGLLHNNAASFGDFWGTAWQESPYHEEGSFGFNVQDKDFTLYNRKNKSSFIGAGAKTVTNSLNINHGGGVIIQNATYLESDGSLFFNDFRLDSTGIRIVTPRLRVGTEAVATMLNYPLNLPAGDGYIWSSNIDGTFNFVDPATLQTDLSSTGLGSLTPNYIPYAVTADSLADSPFYYDGVDITSYIVGNDSIIFMNPSNIFSLSANQTLNGGDKLNLLNLNATVNGVGTGTRNLFGIKGTINSSASLTEVVGIDLDFNVSGSSSAFLGLLSSSITAPATNKNPKMIAIEHTFTGWPNTSSAYYGDYRVSNFPNTSTGNGNNKFYGSYMEMNSPGTPNASLSWPSSNFYGSYISMNTKSLPQAQQKTYGVYIQNLDPHPDEWGIYQATTSIRNYFGGKVGIGTTAPIYNLDVVGALRLNPTTAPVNAEGVFYANDADNRPHYMDGVTDNVLAYRSDIAQPLNQIVYGTGTGITSSNILSLSGTRLNINGTGLTINTPVGDPATNNFDQNGVAFWQFGMMASDYAATPVERYAGPNDFRIYNYDVGYTSIAIENATNRVGIGTGNPQYDLDVAGQIRSQNLTGTTPTQLLGSDVNGVLNRVVLGNTLTLNVDTLNANLESYRQKITTLLEVDANGSTDYLTINEALTAANSLSGPVGILVHPGRYKEKLNITRDSLFIISSVLGGAVIEDIGVSSWTIRTNSVEEIYISGFTILSNETANKYSIRFDGTTERVVFANNTVDALGGEVRAYLDNYTSGAVVYNNTFVNQTNVPGEGGGIRTSNGGTYYNNYIETEEGLGFGYFYTSGGLFISNTIIGGIRVKGGEFRNETYSKSFVDAGSAGTSVFYDCVFAGDNNGGYTLTLNSDAEFYGCDISNYSNAFGGGAALLFNVAGINATLHGGTITAEDLTGNALYAVLNTSGGVSNLYINGTDISGRMNFTDLNLVNTSSYSYYSFDDAAVVNVSDRFSLTPNDNGYPLDLSTSTSAAALPIGTDAQQPTGATGLLRYSTTQSAFQGHDGTSFRELAWADDVTGLTTGLTTNYVPYWNGSEFVDVPGMRWQSNRLYLPNAVQWGPLYTTIDGEDLDMDYPGVNGGMSWDFSDNSEDFMQIQFAAKTLTFINSGQLSIGGAVYRGDGSVNYDGPSASFKYTFYNGGERAFFWSPNLRTFEFDTVSVRFHPYSLSLYNDPTELLGIDPQGFAGNITLGDNLSMAGGVLNTSGGTISGLTANYVPVATSDTTLGNSPVFVSGTKVAIGTTTVAGLLSLDYNSASSTDAILFANNQSSQTFNPTLISHAPNLTAGEYNYLAIGKNASNYNRASWSFRLVNDNSLTNYQTFGFFGADDIFTILANGQIGINRTNPSYSLDINGRSGGVSASLRLIAHDNPPAGSLGVFYTDLSEAVPKFHDGVSYRNLAFADDALWLENGTSAYYNAGNVGIGTSTPLTKLDVQGGAFRVGGDGTPATGAGLEITYNGTAAELLSYNRNTSQYQSLNLRGSAIVFEEGASERMRIDAAKVIVYDQLEVQNLTTTPTKLTGTTAGGILGDITLGSGLSLTSGTLDISGTAVNEDLGNTTDGFTLLGTYNLTSSDGVTINYGTNAIGFTQTSTPIYGWSKFGTDRYYFGINPTTGVVRHETSSASGGFRSYLENNAASLIHQTRISGTLDSDLSIGLNGFLYDGTTFKLGPASDNVTLPLTRPVGGQRLWASNTDGTFTYIDPSTIGGSDGYLKTDWQSNATTTIEAGYNEVYVDNDTESARTTLSGYYLTVGSQDFNDLATLNPGTFSFSARQGYQFYMNPDSAFANNDGIYYLTTWDNKDSRFAFRHTSKTGHPRLELQRRQNNADDYLDQNDIAGELVIQGFGGFNSTSNRDNFGGDMSIIGRAVTNWTDTGGNGNLEFYSTQTGVGPTLVMSAQWNGHLSMHNNLIENLAYPTKALDAVNKAYSDSLSGVISTFPATITTTSTTTVEHNQFVQVDVSGTSGITVTVDVSNLASGHNFHIAVLNTTGSDIMTLDSSSGNIIYEDEAPAATKAFSVAGYHYLWCIWNGTNLIVIEK